MLPTRYIFPQFKSSNGEITNLFNPNGKYSLKLYVVGAWRRIDIDDRIAIDENGQKMLPWIKSNELWLPLLCKGLLKFSLIR